MKSVNKETNNVLSLSPEAWTGREWLIEKVARLSAETLSLHHIDYLVRPDDCLQAQSIVSANCNHNQRSHKWGESIHSSCSFREFRKCRLMQINLYVNASYILKQVSLCVGVHLLTHITAKKKVQNTVWACVTTVCRITSFHQTNLQFHNLLSTPVIRCQCWK